MINWIYKFIDFKDNIIYVGKTKHLEKRMRQHFSLMELPNLKSFSTIQNRNKNIKKFTGHLPDECYENVNHIMVAQISGQTDTEIYETYYINKYKPKYNIDKLYLENQESNLPIEEVKFKEIFLKNESPIKISFNNDYLFKGFTTLEKINETIEQNLYLLKYRPGIIDNNWEINYKISSFLNFCLLNINTYIHLDTSTFDEDINGNIIPLININKKILDLFGIQILKIMQNIGLIVIIDNEIYLTMLKTPYISEEINSIKKLA